jgi:hypothetical protein
VKFVFVPKNDSFCVTFVISHKNIFKFTNFGHEDSG